MKNPNVWPDLAPHLEGDEVPDHPVAHLVGQLACIWIAYQLLYHPGQNIGQFLVQNRSKGIRDIRSCPEQRSSNGNSPVQEVKVILKEKRGSSFLNSRWSSNDDTCSSFSTPWQVSCPWGRSQQGAASPEFSPWKGNAIMISWFLMIDIISFSPNSSPALSLDNPWQGQHHGRFQFPLFSSCWSDEPDMACFHRSSPQLLPFNAYSNIAEVWLGNKQTAHTTGGGGLFDLHSRACKVKKVSWVRKVQESRNNRRGTWRKTLGFVRMKPRHGQRLKSYFATRTGGR